MDMNCTMFGQVIELTPSLMVHLIAYSYLNVSCEQGILFLSKIISSRYLYKT